MLQIFVMHPSLFVSYCRRETPFVSSLVEQLEKSGYPVWLDHRNLIPGSTWQGQILQAIAKADVFLLIVSKEAIASKNVELEWRHALSVKKRIVLVVFEAAQIPSELISCEWIDFRRYFRSSVEQLKQQLDIPQRSSSLPPQKGFKAPKTVWFAFGISLCVSVLSVLTFWTIYIPYHLFPLPYRILKRDFNFFHVQWATIMLHWYFFLSSLMLGIEIEGAVGILYLLAFLASFIAIPLLLLLLRLPALQRWGKPIASRPKFPNRYQHKDTQLKTVTFTIDAAPEDNGYAKILVKELERYGHRYQPTETEEIDVAIVLLSAFKKKTIFNPQERVVYPIILQNTDDLDPDLKAIQWIDFRQGVKNLKQFSMLMGEPSKMLRALGIFPGGKQIILPTSVQAIDFFLTFLCTNFFGSTLLTLILLRTTIPPMILLGISLCTGTFLSFGLLTKQSIITRKGHVKSVARLLASLFFLGILIFIEGMLVVSTGDLEAELTLMSWAAFSTVMMIYFLGMHIILLWILVCWRGLNRWLPHHGGKTAL